MSKFPHQHTPYPSILSRQYFITLSLGNPYILFQHYLTLLAEPYIDWLSDRLSVSSGSIVLVRTHHILLRRLHKPPVSGAD